MAAFIVHRHVALTESVAWLWTLCAGVCAINKHQADMLL